MVISDSRSGGKLHSKASLEFSNTGSAGMTLTRVIAITFPLSEKVLSRVINAEHQDAIDWVSRS